MFRFTTNFEYVINILRITLHMKRNHYMVRIFLQGYIRNFKNCDFSASFKMPRVAMKFRYVFKIKINA